MARRGICHDCWPSGLPAGVTAAGCLHGSWVRSTKAARQESQEEAAEDAAEEE